MNRYDMTNFPKKEEIYSWIQDMTKWGHRKTGTPEGRKSAEYIKAKFESFGLEDVRIEKVPSMCMMPEEYHLEIAGTQYECFFANATNRKAQQGRFEQGFGKENQEFVYLGDGWETDFEENDIQGKIVVCSIRFHNSAPAQTMKWFEHVDIYDPQNLMEKTPEKPDIYSPNNWPANYFRAIQGGAAGFVGILEDYMDDPYFYCEDYTEIGYRFGCHYMSIPGLWISRSEGAKLKKNFDEKPILEGKMKVRTLYEYRDALNVSGRLPGISEDMILVHSHHDAVFDGAVQDASGISEMLALAKYFSQLPEEERKKTMMFAATDTHYTDYQGHQQFIKTRQKEGDNVILDLVVEHVGKEVLLDDQGRMIETGQVESRLVYIAEDSDLYDLVRETFEKYGLEKSIFAKVKTGKGLDTEYEFRQDEVISDAFYFNVSGIPVVSMVAGEIYLFHPSDKIDRVPIQELEPVGKAFAEIALQAAERL